MSTTAEEKKLTEAVKQSDKERQARALLPPREELFPAMYEERAEWYMAQLSIRVINDLVGSDERYWWEEQLTERDRRFVCRIARVDVKAAALRWGGLSFEQRARCIAAFMWLHDWVRQFWPPLSPMLEPATLRREGKS